MARCYTGNLDLFLWTRERGERTNRSMSKCHFTYDTLLPVLLPRISKAVQANFTARCVDAACNTEVNSGVTTTHLIDQPLSSDEDIDCDVSKNYEPSESEASDLDCEIVHSLLHDNTYRIDPCVTLE